MLTGFSKRSTLALAVLAVASSLAAPAVAADFCGRASGEPGALQAEVSNAAGVKEIFRGPEYIAYQDEASQAHPPSPARYARHLVTHVLPNLV